MTPRTQWTEPERYDRSQLAKLVHDQTLLAGSLVTMARTCGKAKCKCRQGHKHVSLYLSIRQDRQRKMIYVPPSLEPFVRDAVETYQRAQRLAGQISQACLERFLAAKAQARQGSAGASQRIGRP